jgi:peptidyl-prolyl cis-trans isomerase B (cyclophilin B)
MALNQLELPAKGEEIAVITTNYGDIKIRLFPEIAPKAVENFKTHAEKGYYDGLIFHRVIPDFMIQGGDPQGTGMGGESIWGTPFEDEFDINYRNFRGSLSMANSGPNTNGSQFFIVQNDEVGEDIIEQMRELGKEKGYPKAVADAYEELGGAFWLDFHHTVFGQVFEGMDVVDKIAAVEIGENAETGEKDKPVEDVIMEKVEIVKYK